jgi:copper(I)-binding protein
MPAFYRFTFYVLLFLLIGCGGENAGISISNAWTRATPTASATAAFYLTITNGGEPDRLLRVDTQVCDSTEIHESVVQTNGVVQMRPIDVTGLTIPNGETEFKVGGLHVMCVGVLSDLVAGEAVAVRVVFENAGIIETTAEIRN